MMMRVAKLCAPWLGYDRVVLMQDLLLAAVELLLSLQAIQTRQIPDYGA